MDRLAGIHLVLLSIVIAAVLGACELVVQRSEIRHRGLVISYPPEWNVYVPDPEGAGRIGMFRSPFLYLGNADFGGSAPEASVMPFRLDPGQLAMEFSVARIPSDQVAPPPGRSEATTVAGVEGFYSIDAGEAGLRAEVTEWWLFPSPHDEDLYYIIRVFVRGGTGSTTQQLQDAARQTVERMRFDSAP
jgi:hypothetical protein